jgi:hypothetical protein
MVGAFGGQVSRRRLPNHTPFTGAAVTRFDKSDG